VQIETVEILFEDQDFIAVRKPAGLLVHRSSLAAGETLALVQILREQIGRKVFPVHRLDRPTSGVIIFALSSKSAKLLVAEFAEQKVRKKYLALVRGFAKDVVLDYPLIEELDEIADRQAQKNKPAQSAVTQFKVLQTCEVDFSVDRYLTSRYSLVEAMPHTGRKHQIRRHLRHLGHPIIGDVNHGVGKHNRFFKKQFGCTRMLLACVEISFAHPVTGKNILIRASVCPDFQKIVDQIFFGKTMDTAQPRQTSMPKLASLVVKKERQRKTKDPCPECFLHKDLCICSQIPRLEFGTKLSLIVHAKELKRTTNTGRLAVKALVNSQMLVRGLKDSPLSLKNLISCEEQPLLFFPSEDAQELTAELVAQFKKPIHLIVPDGNWRQASKVNSRYPELTYVPRVKISTPNLSDKHLRTESTEEGMATLQAIACAFRMIEGEKAFESLHQLYLAKLHATLKGRGQKL
jgi:tRNA pseudouridine65 synthase